MNKKILSLVILTLLVPVLVFSQTVNLETMGVSPAQIKADTVGNPGYIGLLDRVYSGLLNVGVETQMVLKGTSDMALVSHSWNVLSAPEGSVAAIMNDMVIDTSTQMATFIPDLEGTYILEFSDQGEISSVTVNAAKYIGVGNEGGCGNAFCHSGKVSDWMETDHSTMLNRGLEGTLSSHYSGSCISCHTTGYDLDAANDGFDDFDFVFPTELIGGMTDSMKTTYPDAMHRANIQCESCHGPASAHNGNTADSRMVASLKTAVCATCHDDDHYHVYPSQWNEAGHSNIPPYPAGNRTDCRGCHNGAQFVQFADGEEITKQAPVDITCATCHDPHESFGDTPEADNGRFQIRIVDGTLSNGMEIMDGGKGKLCMNCHQSRKDGATYTNEPHGHYGPHYAPQADMLIGKNAATFGKELPSSAHLAATENACIDCHMYEAEGHVEHNPDGSLNTAGMHSFSMVSKEGQDNVAACLDCHGEIGETFGEKKYFYGGTADHDKDGVEEGLQDEVHGMLDMLGAMLPDADVHADVDETWTVTELKAAFNHRLVYYDHSYGIHNPAFTVALLNLSMEALENSDLAGEIVAIDDVPNDQGKSVKIIWDKMAGDGVSADPVENYSVKRFDTYDETWTTVGEVTADGSMRYALVVPTVFDSTADGDGVTDFMVVALAASGSVHESMVAAGYSIDNLIPMAPMNIAALLEGADVNISWEAAGDPDINYYRVFRSTEQGFEPVEDTEIGTTAELMFTDSQMDAGDYYYKVVAVDFSGNDGNPSAEVNAKVTAIGDDLNAPLDFALSQNYPNPFNPVTTIDFSLLKEGYVAISVYNTLGQEVQKLVNKVLPTGTYSVNFNANGLSSGVYVYRIQVLNGSAVQFQKMHKMILMK